MKKKSLPFVIFITIILILNLTIVNATNKNNSNLQNYFRIHVVANSDSIDDQILKLEISKKIHSYLPQITNANYSKDAIKKNVITHIEDILTIADDTIKEKGYDYSVKAYIGNIVYDIKSKNSIKMDAGVYDSLKLIIGNGNGENWWSLIFPYVSEEYTMEEIMDTQDISFESGIIQFIKKII